jgi:DNA polymerase III subunit gamma/tau
MSYQVLARKYRPRDFTEMVGQAHVLRALANGLDQQRLHHAFLFTGTRGVGKTTIARVLARCLNCEAGVSSKPCGVCSACAEIGEGRFVDLIEVDAASRTKVEDTRELLDNVQYAPARGRYKIYLIDEVHMLSAHSFNALLKTLEEPPPHVKFLLATTDPQKLPVTVLSRCLQFNLKRLSVDLIAGHLHHVLELEQVGFEERALRRLAKAADGSLRDALSLTDQAIAHGGGEVLDAAVVDMLGSIDDDAVLRCLEALSSGDGALALHVVAGLAEHAADFELVLAGLLDALHRLALLQWMPESVPAAEPERERLLALANLLSPEDVQLYYQIGVQGRQDLSLVPDQRAGFEMLLLRMLHFRLDVLQEPAQVTPTVLSPPRSPVAAEQQPAPGRAGSAPAPAGRAAAALAAAQRQRAEPKGQRGLDSAPPAVSRSEPLEPVNSPATRVVVRDAADWSALVERLDITGVAKALITQCAWGGQHEGQLVLHLPRAQAALRLPDAEERIECLLADAFGGALALRIELVADGVGLDTPASRQEARLQALQAAAEAAIDADPTVRTLRDVFGAELVRDSIRPINHNRSS